MSILDLRGPRDLVVSDLYRGYVESMLEKKEDPEGKEDCKYDKGKNIAGVLFEDFPNALDGVSSVATFGAEKYKRSSWCTVENGLQRYQDALVRHQIAKGRGETLDPESGRPHSWHIAWNALAIAELEARLSESEEGQKEKGPGG